MTAKETNSKRIPKTAMTPTCPSSLRSKMTTETTFDFGANNRIAALSSRITPMKMKDQAAISPERASGAVTSLRDMSRLAPIIRLASSSSG
jgi:hypothetical protein